MALSRRNKTGKGSQKAADKTERNEDENSGEVCLNFYFLMYFLIKIYFFPKLNNCKVILIPTHISVKTFSLKYS